MCPISRASLKPRTAKVSNASLTGSPANALRRKRTVSRTVVSGRSYGRAFCICTMNGDDEPMPSEKRPGASTASDAALIAITAGPRVCTGNTAQPTRSEGAHSAAIASGTKPSRSCASLLHTPS